MLADSSGMMDILLSLVVLNFKGILLLEQGKGVEDKRYW